jgi:hypothetical protein
VRSMKDNRDYWGEVAAKLRLLLLSVVPWQVSFRGTAPRRVPRAPPCFAAQTTPDYGP